MTVSFSSFARTRYFEIASLPFATCGHLILSFDLFSMTKPPAEKVYLVLKHIFKGEKVKASIIRGHIEKHSKEQAISALIAKHGIDDVYIAAKRLIDEDIFCSTLKAKQKFSKLFKVTPAQTASKKSSEAAAARIEVEAFKNIDYTEGRQQSPAPRIKEKQIGTYRQFLTRTVLIFICVLRGQMEKSSRLASSCNNRSPFAVVSCLFPIS